MRGALLLGVALAEAPSDCVALEKRVAALETYVRDLVIANTQAHHVVETQKTAIESLIDKFAQVNTANTEVQGGIVKLKGRYDDLNAANTQAQQRLTDVEHHLKMCAAQSPTV